MKLRDRAGEPDASEPAATVEHAVPEGVRSILEASEGAPLASTADAPVGPAPAAAFGNLAMAQIIDVRGDAIDVRLGGRTVEAKRATILDEAVLATAMETGEPVLVERAPDGSVTVVGALRTRATPGVDKMKDITIEADRIALVGKKEVTLATSGVARIALRAAGEIETYADRIVSRAEELHKIVGRMLRLN